MIGHGTPVSSILVVVPEIIVHAVVVLGLANYIMGNVTLGSNVALRRMLLSDRRNSLSEEQHDEPEKQKMLDEFASATVYHRKHAIRVLKNQRQVQNHLKRKGKTYKAIDSGEVVQVLEQIWKIYGHIFSKRLQPFLPEAIKVLERCKEIEISQEVKVLLLKISSAGIDRCLRPVRIKSPYGLSTAKLGSLLKI